MRPSQARKASHLNAASGTCSAPGREISYRSVEHAVPTRCLLEPGHESDGPAKGSFDVELLRQTSKFSNCRTIRRFTRLCCTSEPRLKGVFSAVLSHKTAKALPKYRHRIATFMVNQSFPVIVTRSAVTTPEFASRRCENATNPVLLFQFQP